MTPVLMRTIRRRVVVAGWVAGAALGCAPSPAPSSSGGAAAIADSAAPAESDSARLVRLEAEARGLAKTEGCASDAQCRVAPVGRRGCGGPRTYLAYCPLATDSAALFAKLDELARAEGEYNERHGIASTCEMRLPPAASLSGGRCVGDGGGGGRGGTAP